MGNVILWILFGALGGWVAYIMAAEMKLMSVGAYVFIGALGAIMGGAIAILFGGSLSEYNAASQLTAMLGSGSVLMATHLFRDPST